MKLLLYPLCLVMTFSLLSSPAFADTLADIYQLALNNDPTLKSAEATYRANLETEKQNRSALLPQISATAGYTQQDFDSDGFNVNVDAAVESNRDTDTTSWGATLDQTIFDLSAWYTFKSGKETSLQAEAQLAYDQQQLILRVANAYFSVLRALENLEASKAEERATKRQLEQTQQRFDVGLIAITDVHEARAVYDSTVVQRLTDEGNLGTSYEALTVLTGQSHTSIWPLNKDYPVVNPVPIARNEWVDFALKNNNQLQAATYAAEAARKNATSKKMNHAPTISGRLRYDNDDTSGDFTSPTASFPLDSEDDGTTISLTLTVPLYSGGGVSATRRQAYEQYNAALQNKIATQRNVIKDTRASHITLMTDVQRVKARQQAIVSTSSALEATQSGYEVGTRNIVDVLQAQRSLFSAIRDYANSRYGYVLNLLTLKQAAGTLTPQDIKDINQWLVAPGTPEANQYKELLDN